MNRPRAVLLQVWLITGLVLVAGILDLGLIRDAPRGLEEMGVGRGCASGFVWLVWLVCLAPVIVATRSLRKRPDLSWPATIGLSMLFWSIGLGVSGFLAYNWFKSTPTGALNGNEQRAAQELWVVADAETTFKERDLDGNKVRDYWTGDVRGLYTLKAGNPKQPIRLISLMCAGSDRRALQSTSDPQVVDETRHPFAGYHAQAMAAYSVPDGRNEQHFGFCAVPASKAAGRKTLIVNEAGQVWSKDLDGAPVERWPLDPAKEGWILFPRPRY